ncbi:unnamed protein product [Protopolystoma xenopodis]|uniref:Uncharacterized protein n=1 Tax=Protopolystoma xenopodis TaxID=117903 RepID=A0A448WRC1_9PLAT|nr:unnamed protein product [Protopolystoma xenopodis]
MKKPGNELCGVSLGNGCRSVLGTDSYACQCHGIWHIDIRLNEDNCQLRLDSVSDYEQLDGTSDSKLLPADGQVNLESEKEDSNATSRRIDIHQLDLIMKKKIDSYQPNCQHKSLVLTSIDKTQYSCVCPTGPTGYKLYEGKLINCR